MLSRKEAEEREAEEKAEEREAEEKVEEIETEREREEESLQALAPAAPSLLLLMPLQPLKEHLRAGARDLSRQRHL